MEYWFKGSVGIIENSNIIAFEPKVIEFGYKAEKIFKELAEDENDKEYRFFRQFKMMLHNESVSLFDW